MWKKAEKYLQKDEYIGSLIKKYGPCEIEPKKHIDYFQALVGEIIGQQLSGKAASTIYQRVKVKIGPRITANKILALSHQDLRDCGTSWAKARSLHDLAFCIKTRKLHVGKLAELPDKQIISELVAVKGIGLWTAEMFMMFTLGRQDVFSLGDLGLRKGLAKLVGKSFSPKEAETFALRWKPYRTLASWYVWKVVDN